ncbi:hypothetical protein DFH29DRAFT_985434 [Suillus ampliporus]|nr:hypothetical protein DFH29DRAFT_985434 [Suillus ampliporus]
MLVAHVELQLTVEGRWEIGCDEYNRFKMEACLGKYRTALDDLERLVVMDCSSFLNCHCQGQLRQQIGEALQRRSEAIRNVINHYNIQAIALNPPPHEELTRLNVEICRLRTAIHAEQVQTTAVIEDLRLSDPKLAEELQHQWRVRGVGVCV